MERISSNIVSAKQLANHISSAWVEDFHCFKIRLLDQKSMPQPGSIICENLLHFVCAKNLANQLSQRRHISYEYNRVELPYHKINESMVKVKVVNNVKFVSAQ